MKKILVIRFSSIGDIVLTTPVVRCIKKALPGVELHYLTRNNFSGILDANPYIDKVISIEKDINEVIALLKAENYDHIIDLHHNLRSASVKMKLSVKATSFNKLNVEKWMLVNLRINFLPSTHIVNRYFGAVPFPEVKYDGEGLDYFIPEDEQVNIVSKIGQRFAKYYAFVIGAKHYTKKLPAERISELIKRIDLPVILLGGPEDNVMAEEIMQTCSNFAFNACGKFSLNGSASLVRQAQFVITHDTGLMHIGAAFNKKIISVWGNTIPGFGMYPFFAEGRGESFVAENNDIRCRPCSKIGFEKCPKGHFNCMNRNNFEGIVTTAVKWW